MVNDRVRTQTAHAANGALRDGILVFALIAVASIVYAFNAQATYRATAAVQFNAEPAHGTAWPDPDQASARLRAYLLDPTFLAHLAETRESESSGAESPRHIAESIGVAANGPRRFAVSATATSAARAQEFANGLAERAANGAESILDPPPMRSAIPESGAAAELAAFVRAHPEIIAPPSAITETGSAEPDVTTLLEERKRLRASLARPPVPGENPYAEPSRSPERAPLEHRLHEIDAELEAHRKTPVPTTSAAPGSVSPAVPSPEERAQWERLLHAVEEVRPPSAPVRVPRIRATAVPAPLPVAPERPNRWLVVMVGLTVGTVWGAGAALGRSYWLVRSATRRSGLARSRGRAQAFPPGMGDGALGRRLAEVLWPARKPVRPARILAQHVPSGWRPEPSLLAASRTALCDELLPFAVESCFVVGVTAVPEANTRKAALAAELALALAGPGERRVLLIDANLHLPELDRVLNVEMPETAGFSQQLRERLHAADDAHWQVVDCGHSLHVIVEGSSRSPGMLLSSQFEEAIRSLRTHYDVIVVNGPLTSAELDCRALDAVLDGVVVACPAAGSSFLEHALGIFTGKRFTRVVEV